MYIIFFHQSYKRLFKQWGIDRSKFIPLNYNVYICRSWGNELEYRFSWSLSKINNMFLCEDEDYILSMILGGMRISYIKIDNPRLPKILSIIDYYLTKTKRKNSFGLLNFNTETKHPELNGWGYQTFPMEKSNILSILLKIAMQADYSKLQK